MYTGTYTGTGTYGESNPVTIQFPFEPILFFFPISAEENFPISSPLDTSFLTTSYKQVGRVQYTSTVGSAVYSAALQIKFSDTNRKKILIYSTQGTTSQSNASGAIYYFAAIGGYNMGGVTDWIITTSGTWVVPKTGRYYLELYGGGGGVDYYGSLSAGVSAQGGSSCQSYDSIYLTVGDSISVIIGTCGYARYDMTSTATATSFGTYSVEGGGNGNGKTSSGGTGAGNLGINGHTVSYNSASYVYNNGVLGTLYGVGGYGGRNSTTSQGQKGTDGAVYLKYLRV